MRFVKFGPYIAWLVVAVALSLPAWLTPGWIPFKNFTQTDILQLLTALFLIALFLERALEVFLTTWRGPDAADKELAVVTARRKVEAVAAATKELKDDQSKAVAEAHKVLAVAEQDRTSYKSVTQRYALWAGLTVGLLVSAAGIRTLQPLVDPTRLPGDHRFFNLIDAFLTGGLLAGGSDGIHKITQVFTSFMESTASKAKG